ncbi:MAG: hypothetical protein IJT66_05260, partial [Clostridia bacterium]|nr:hypothetical protein [Clostridia bacterium]
KERMEAFKEKLSEEDQTSLEFLYYLIDLDEMTEESRKVYLAESPALEKVSQFYNIDGLFRGSAGITKIPEYASQEAEEIFSRAGYTQEDMERDYAETGLEFPEDKKAIFELSVEYILDEYGLSVRIPHDSIQYDKTKFRITEVDLLPYFGAASAKQDGYIVVPDGAGALINLNNGKTQYATYKKHIYGEDKAINYADLQTGDGTNIVLPVFGIQTKERGFVGIVEDGAASCSITADISGRYHSYNHASAVFLLTPNALISKSASLAALDFQEEILSSDLSVRYLTLPENQRNYSGMASALRAYFLKTGVLPSEGSTVSNGLTLDLLAAVKGMKSFLGYEYYATYPLTDYSAARRIAEWFQGQEVSSISLLYEGWSKDTLDNGLASNVAFSRALGGRSGFQKLSAYAEENGISLIPDANFSFVSEKSLSGFSESKFAARNIQGAVATETLYEYGTMRKATVGTGDYLVKPTAYLQIADKFLTKYSALKVKQLFVRSIGSQVYSDFHRGKLVDREQAVKEASSLLEKLGKEYRLTVDGGNLYAVQNAEKVVDFPLESGKAYLLDSEIPLVSMVYNGTLQLNAKITGDHSAKWFALKLIESGVYPEIEMIDSNISQLREAESRKICRSFETVREEVLEIYREVDEALQKVNGETILSHEQKKPGVTATTFANGYTILVNHNETPVTISGQTLEALSWLTINGKEMN